ncbi:MAG TPA: deoxyribose-phosphate aldolase [Candidatus Acidoferrales bacterium]
MGSEPMDPKQLEKVVHLIAEEVIAYLGGAPATSAGLDLDEIVCPGCDQACIEKCLRKTRAVIDAGADRISAGAGVTQVETDLAHYIDHTLLKPEASRADITKLCQEAVKFGFASVCVNPWYVPLVAEQVRGSQVKVCTVVGFPLGATLPQVKIREAEEVLKLGAQEVDMVMNVGALKSGQDEVVEQDIRGVAEACHRCGAILKVILETALLTDEEKVRACAAAKRAAADFVKTSTGFGPGGATAEDVALMRCIVGSDVGVKASGGIRSLADVKKMVTAGATRIGASASVRILEEAARSPAPAAGAG